MRFRCGLVVCADAILNFCILACSYPIWWEFEYMRYPNNYWWAIYSWAAVLGTAVVLVLSLATYIVLKKQSPNVMMFAHMFISFVVLSAISVLGGTSGTDTLATWYPLADIDAKFFSELQILRFIPLCATSMGIFAGVLFRLVLPKKRSHNNL
jgi:hypothetical protein